MCSPRTMKSLVCGEILEMASCANSWSPWRREEKRDHRKTGTLSLVSILEDYLSPWKTGMEMEGSFKGPGSGIGHQNGTIRIPNLQTARTTEMVLSLSWDYLVLLYFSPHSHPKKAGASSGGDTRTIVINGGTNKLNWKKCLLPVLIGGTITAAFR